MEEYIKWECIVCGLIYDEAEGWPEDGIEPGTKWEDCLLYTSDAADDTPCVDLGGRRIIKKKR